MKPNTSFCRKEPFWERTWNFLLIFDGLGLLAFLSPNTSNDNCQKHYKTRGFVVFLLCFCVVVAQTTKTKQQTNKQQQQQSKQEQATTTKQQSWDPKFK